MFKRQLNAELTPYSLFVDFETGERRVGFGLFAVTDGSRFGYPVGAPGASGPHRFPFSVSATEILTWFLKSADYAAVLT